LKIILLDRDGVINKDPGPKQYITSPEELYMLPGVVDAIRKLNMAGYEVTVVSNQAGVAKGFYTQKCLDEITKKMLSLIENGGGKIRQVLYCTHRDEDNCDCKKPKPGLLKNAMAGLEVNPKDVFFIGDGAVDIMAGKALGCKTILVLSGRLTMETRAQWGVEPDYIASDLYDAVEKIVLNDAIKKI
jgi:histidinol-phosphate phosphatase family protein